MYKVYCDGLTLHDLSSEGLFLNSPSLTLKDNDSGQFSFTISVKHPHYDDIKKLKSVITIYHNNVLIFTGRPTEERTDLYKNKKFVCKGELDYLTDTIQRPAEYHDMTVRGFLETLIEVHNAQADNFKQFTVGQVTVTDSNDSLYRYTNYENTLQAIKEKLIKRLGGHIRIRVQNNVRYIDYLADYPNVNEQVIEFGKNLLDFSTTIDATDIVTAVIPLGGKLATSTIQALDERLTIKSVNNGCDFLYTQSAVDNFGWVFRVVTFDDVNVASNLKNKGANYLQNVQFENLVLSVSAVDLNNLDVSIERINLLDTIRVISEPHGLDRYFPVTELKLSLDSPEKDKITLGSELETSFSSSNVSANQDIIDRINAIPSERIILNEAIANATALITAATHGHVVLTPEEILIMDTDDVETATKVWRWNLNGFGYSNGGYNGSYVPAITMDGTIVGQRIVAGSISADKLDTVYRTSVETQIQTAQSTAESNAADYTDTALQPYWTRLEVENAISVNGDGVLLSAKGYAENYTDTQLQNYTKSADLQVTLDGITSTVAQKLNSNELSTKIQQSATDVKIAWNNISKYIQFANAELQIYDSANTSTQKLRSKLNDSGHHFYRDGYYVGKIGTNQWSSNNNHKGLVFDLEPNGKYMAFSQKASSSDTSYTTMLCFSRANSIYSEYGMHLGCDMNAHNYTIKNVYLEDVSVKDGSTNRAGFTGAIPIVTAIGSPDVDVDFDGQTVSVNVVVNYTSSKLRVVDGIVVGYWN